MEHTQQIWEVDWHTTQHHPYKYTISEVQETPEEAEANAKLIAAAPELLEACMTVVNGYEGGGIDMNIFYEECNQAIKKATE